MYFLDSYLSSKSSSLFKMPPNASPNTPSSTLADREESRFGLPAENDFQNSPPPQIRCRKLSHAEQLMQKVIEGTENVEHAMMNMLHNAWNVSLQHLLYSVNYMYHILWFFRSAIFRTCQNGYKTMITCILVIDLLSPLSKLVSGLSFDCIQKHWTFGLTV